MDGTENIPGQNHAHQVTVPCIVFFAVTPIFIAIRLGGRLYSRSGLGWDDWTIIVSFTCALVVQILMMISCHYGFGQHIDNMTIPNKLMALKLFYVAQIFYKITINLTKTSILLLYLRIFLQKWFRICCYVLMGIILAYMVATVASSIWQCTPIAGAWDKSINPRCIDLTKNWYGNAGFSIATDVLILLLPMQPIWASNLAPYQKRALVIVFALGIFVIVTSILRATTLDFSTGGRDITYNIASSMWTIIEQNVGIICACLPMCRKPLAWLFPACFAARPRSTPKPSPSSSKQHSKGRSGTDNSLRASNDDLEWKPWVGSQDAAGNQSVISRHDAASEEYILASLPGHEDLNEGIRKTTRYDVTYEVP